MKLIMAEENPTMFGGYPAVFAVGLAYDERDIEEELQLIAAVRRHVARIMKTLQPEQFGRAGEHSVDGPISLEVLPQRITNLIPNHIAFIEEKRAAF